MISSPFPAEIGTETQKMVDVFKAVSVLFFFAIALAAAALACVLYLATAPKTEFATGSQGIATTSYSHLASSPSGGRSCRDHVCEKGLCCLLLQIYDEHPGPASFHEHTYKSAAEDFMPLMVRTVPMPLTSCLHLLTLPLALQ